MPDETYAGPFAATLQQIRKGELHAELGDSLRDLVAGVMTIGKPGSLTLKITVKPAAKNADMVIVEDEITVKDPRPDRPASLFYATDEGGLTRHNPNQPELPLRQVKGEAQQG
jgi:hypothetical protein